MTYDCQRDQDAINVGTHSDVMVLADQDEDPKNKHPYWYAHVIGIFHAMVQQVRLRSSTSYEHMDFLWVRWYGLDVHAQSGFKAHQLHQVGFLDSNDLGAFGFINPQDLIRAVHLISAFEFRKTSSLLSQSIGHREDEGHNDYEQYYFNMCVYCTSICYDHTNILGGPRFVDRDMFMCFCGLGPGHQATRTITKVFRDEVRLAFGIACEDEGETTAERQQIQRDVESEGLQDPEAELDQEEDGDYSEDAEEDIDTVGVGDVVVGHDSDLNELEYAPL